MKLDSALVLDSIRKPVAAGTVEDTMIATSKNVEGGGNGYRTMIGTCVYPGPVVFSFLLFSVLAALAYTSQQNTFIINAKAQSLHAPYLGYMGFRSPKMTENV